MYDLLRWILSLAVTAAAVLFAIANRASVALVWNPLGPPLNLPLCAAVLGGAVIGFFTGGAFVWLNARSLRTEHRRHRKKIGELERQLETAHEKT